MNKKIILLLIFIFSHLFYYNFVFSASQENQSSADRLQSDYKLLAPLKNPYPSPEGPKQLETISVTSEGAEDAFSNYVNIIIRLSIGIIAVLAVLMLIIGGLGYIISDLPAEKINSKSKITNAILGLLLAMGSYLILLTINPDLVKTRVGITDSTLRRTLSRTGLFKDEDKAQEPETKEGKKFLCSAYEVDSKWPPNNEPEPNLSATVNHFGEQCASVGQKRCTSTYGLDPSIVKAIRNACPNCFLEITGGTECWLHSKNTTHGMGNATVDLGKHILTGGDPNLSLDKFVREKGKKVGEKIYKIDEVGENIRFFDEDQFHWHVYFK